MAETAPVCDFGWKAPAFSLPATDGKVYTLDDIKGPNGILVVFICNHCPYVQAILDRLIRDAAALAHLGIGTAAISSNDVRTYPEDSFPRMKGEAPEFSLEATLRGEIPSPIDVPSGCRFHPRCAIARAGCAEQEPRLREIATGHWAACAFPGEAR